MSEEQTQQHEMSPEEQKANAAKLLAEAEKATAEAEEARQRARKEAAIAEKEQAWADQAKAEARREIANHDKYRIHNEEELNKVLAEDRFYRKYQYTYPVTTNSVRECMNTLNMWHRQDEKNGIIQPFEIVFYSPGGEVISGMYLFDHIRWLIAQGHDVTTTCMGEAASMGGILLQAGVTRKMGREASVLIHEIQFGAMGDKGDMDDAVARADMIQNRVVKIFTERAKATGRKGALTPTAMRRKWRRKDWWLDNDECYRLGIVDEVI